MANDSQEELARFQAAHFSTATVSHFATHFLGPVDEHDEYEDEIIDDGLGYYDDGVKRTLTDEQIAIFRHSEVETLLRERRHNALANASTTESLEPLVSPMPAIIGPVQPDSPPSALHEAEDGEIEDASTPATSSTAAEGTQVLGKKKKNKKKKSKNPGVRNLHVKPDLRKRTWDVVEKAAQGPMDYGEAPGKEEVDRNTAPKRRMVSYDDV